MTQDLPQNALASGKAFNRSEDRRISKQIVPPPYQTADGTITDDRRSHMDRRASWLREFSLDIDLPG